MLLLNGVDLSVHGTSQSMFGVQGGSDFGFSSCTAPAYYTVSKYLKHAVWDSMPRDSPSLVDSQGKIIELKIGA